MKQLHPMNHTTKKMEKKTMLDAKVVQLLKQQINEGFYSANLYFAFSGYFCGKALNGFGNWYLIQAMEHRDRAMLFRQYLQKNGELVLPEAIPQRDVALTDNMTVLKEGLKHEIYVTSLIHTIYEAAYVVRDFRTMQFLVWFIKEQCEEEKNADELIRKFEMCGDDPRSLYMLDSEMAARVYTAPSLTL